MAVKVTRTSPEVTFRIRGMIDLLGVRPVGRRLRLADATVARLAAGLPVTEGVAALATQRLADLELSECTRWGDHSTCANTR